MKIKLGYLLLDIDDWFAKRHIYFNLFVKDKENQVSFLSRWGYDLVNVFRLERIKICPKCGKPELTEADKASIYFKDMCNECCDKGYEENNNNGGN